MNKRQNTYIDSKIITGGDQNLSRHKHTCRKLKQQIEMASKLLKLVISI